ncbi:hypothetical protein F2P56_004806 [Juglans regia]|uniref:Uncharacterized protein LOC109014518 n=2 Tax=Juglans regia TaxID=51240 RepID=A0A2I4H8T6_JUGRE|nr:uncharacterized protein LOC109014518 [Juglans regia]KAF5478227.1 hypothetical protein F2P56_004806 [Juglans regia]
MVLKLDISKAYDIIEWGFLEAVMRKLGFGEQWIFLVMLCVTSVTYFVLVNGQPGKVINPSRGIRQGDPIFPYLLMLCAEGLSSLLESIERRGQKSLNGYEKYLGLPSIVGSSRYNTFKNLKERLWLKVNSWENNFLSQAGKEILLKAVMQAIPTYSMSAFRLLEGYAKKNQLFWQDFSGGIA